jgi:hypothetical protein
VLAGEHFGIVLFATLCGREPGLSELFVVHTLAGDFKPTPGDATRRPGLNCCPRASRTREAHRENHAHGKRGALHCFRNLELRGACRIGGAGGAECTVLPTAHFVVEVAA